MPGFAIRSLLLVAALVFAVQDGSGVKEAQHSKEIYDDCKKMCWSGVSCFECGKLLAAR